MYAYPANFGLGDRVELKLGISISERDQSLNQTYSGCIIYLSNSKGDGIDIGLALDTYGLNMALSDKELELQKKFSVPGDGSNVMIIAAFDRRFDIRIQKIKNYNSTNCSASSLMLCNLKACGRVKQRANMLITCNDLHCICAWHITPWREDKKAIDETTILPYLRLLKSSQEYLSADHSSDARYCIETKAVLTFYKWRATAPKELKDRVMSEALFIGARSCECCVSSFTKRSGLSIEQWHEQLFPGSAQVSSSTSRRSSAYAAATPESGAPMALPWDRNPRRSDPGYLERSQSSVNGLQNRTSASSSASHSALLSSARQHYQQQRQGTQSRSPGTSTAVSSRYYSLPQHVYRELQRRGYHISQIDSIVSQQSVLELETIDADVLEALIVSTEGAERPSGRREAAWEQKEEMAEGAFDMSMVVVLLTPIAVDVMCTLFNRKDRVTLSEGMSHTDILQLIRRKLEISEVSMDMLYRMDRSSTSATSGSGCGGGWCEDIAAIATESITAPSSLPNGSRRRGSTSEDAVGELTVRDLQPNDVLLICCSRDCVGPRCRLTVLARQMKYNEPSLHKVKRLMSVYDGWRPIRGDGNCYYRAVIFGLLEQLVERKDGNRMRSLAACFEEVVALDRRQTVPEESGDVTKIHLKYMLSMLRYAASGKCWLEVSELESDLLDPNSKLDLAFVLASRLLVSKYLLENQNRELNGLSIQNAILPSYPDVSDMREYCKKYVECMGVDAEGPVVSGGLLLEALQCSGRTVFLDRRAEVDLTVVGSSYEADGRQESQAPNSSSGPAATVVIHLLLRPGHYDLLYPKYPSNEPAEDISRGGVGSRRLSWATVESAPERNHPKADDSSVSDKGREDLKQPLSGEREGEGPDSLSLRFPQEDQQGSEVEGTSSSARVSGARKKGSVDAIQKPTASDDAPEGVKNKGILRYFLCCVQSSSAI